MNQIPFFVLIFVESSYENKEEVDDDYSSVYILLLNHSLLILSKYVLKLQARKPFYYCPLHETLGMNTYKIFGEILLLYYTCICASICAGANVLSDTVTRSLMQSLFHKGTPGTGRMNILTQKSYISLKYDLY